MMQVTDVHKAIDGKAILRGASFTIEPGKITGLVGRNGAGKTTLLRTLVGIYDPDHGSVLFHGTDIHKHAACKQEVVFVPDAPTALEMYTIRECAAWYGMIYPNFDLFFFTSAMERFKLPMNKRVRTLSKGMKMLFSTALGLATKAKLILFDEPTNGVDAVAKKQLLSLIVNSLDEHNSIVISSHMLGELDRMADTVVLLQEGRTDDIWELEHLRERMKKLQVVFNGDKPPMWLHRADVFVLQQVGRVNTVILETDEAMAALQELNPLLVDELPLTLEDWFIGKAGDNDDEA
ncbi:ATP-binding cassette domain-containing protein [Paenibacillus alvei]|uniref:ABC transporter ATP-binding protein n=1 Tax=Paenibacillus alvei TaxID=44250 RepID=A0AAP7DI04_PAEAL|nr:ABC transporter ATP-binding protein [Paenibacillus alvei]MBG9735880.1 ABC transporter ATP-binding protein [Paenibacillus alvei]MBG9742475.1 ABC transporter ATP-binding protein [Paenibacillus alvei]MCY9578147.1 ABC transporter ATP-binding protein [Paenibacillus alvei]MCY9586625.1 ABC transporter ATP-binding protein [Paenibacillus alvei]NOJ71153.1 ABC transporter ATP-binding protein [Paenibacillus alvei]